MERRYHTTVSVTSGPSSRVDRQREGPVAQSIALQPTSAAAAALPPRLRHPGPQCDLKQDASTSAALDPHAQRVVAALLHELDAARQRGAAAQAELAAAHRQLSVRKPHPQAQQAQHGGSRSDTTSVNPLGPPKARGVAAVAAPNGHIQAFRPPGAAATAPRQHPAAARRPALPGPAAADAAALWRDNAEMKGHLQELLAHCQNLQSQLEAATAAASACHSACAQHPPCSASQSDEAAAGAAALSSSPRQLRPRSPGRGAAVVVSPRAGGADLAMAVFEEPRHAAATPVLQPPPADPGELRLALNRAQRHNLKLGSKLARAQEDAAERAAEARRWQQAVEQQAGTIGSLRVELEGERRRQRDLEAALASGAAEVSAGQEHVTALIGQLGAAEAAAAAAEGEAACLRGQLAAVEEQRGWAVCEVERLKEEAVSTAARLSATDVVRREAERERDELELHGQRLRAALAEVEAGGAADRDDLCAQLATAQHQLAAERQRAHMLQAQLSLAEAQGRDTERVLSEQLRAVQEERNTCLAAATRADALLVRLGQHALTTRGADR